VVGDPGIEPLTQTLDDVLKDFGSSTVLKAAGPDGEILGSVRGRREAGVFVFKLSVDPAAQGRGCGTALMRALERALPARRYWLFTRSGNLPAMAVYLKLGYSLYKEEDAGLRLRFAYFEKLVPDGPDPEIPAPGSHVQGSGNPRP
jgi:ribosomal protein S18 acetylase RimI-like enzyme